MFTTEELQLIADALAAHYTRWHDEEMRVLLDKVIERRQMRIRLRDHDEVDVNGVPKPRELLAAIDEACKPWPPEFAGVPMPKQGVTDWVWPEDTKFYTIHEGPNYNRPKDKSGAQRIPTHLKNRTMPKLPELHDITPEVMNRILRTIYPNEMG